jgi:hypothetical protein
MLESEGKRATVRRTSNQAQQGHLLEADDVVVEKYRGGAEGQLNQEVENDSLGFISARLKLRLGACGG